MQEWEIGSQVTNPYNLSDGLINLIILLFPDEILYHSRIHPERRCNTLTDDELASLHTQTHHVCQVAVEVNADDTKFPQDWLFKHRWVRTSLADYIGKRA